MEESLPASLLVLAGLLRLAGVSQSEPWSSRPAGLTSLEEGLVTTKTRPGSPGEGDEAEATLQFDSIASALAAAAASHARDATEGAPGDKDQLLTLTVPASARESERPEPLPDAATAGLQRDAPFTSKPLAGLSALPGAPKTESSSLPKHPAKFLPREEQAGNSTAPEVIKGERSSPVPSKTSAVEPFSSLRVGSDSFESAGPQVTLSTSLRPATVAGDLHMLTLIKDTEAPSGRTTRTSAKESPEARLTVVRASSPHAQGRSQPAVRTDSGSPVVFRTADLLAWPPSPFATLRFSATSWPALSEGPVAIISRTKMSSLASSPHGEVQEHKLTEHGKTENPTPLAPSQSNTRPFPLWRAPSLRTSSPPVFSEDVGQGSLSKLVFSSRSPSSSKPAASTHLEACMTLTLHHEMGPQTAAQASHFRLPQTAALLEGRLPVSQAQEATIAVSVPAGSKAPPSAVLPPVRGQAQVRVPSMTPMGDSIPSRPTMSALAASSKVGSPSLAVSAAAATPAGEISRFRPRFPLPATPPSVYGQQPLPSTLASSSAPAPTKQQTPGIPSGLKRLAGPPPPQAEPVLISALAQTEAPSPGRPAARHAELSTSAVIDSAPSRLKTPALSTPAGGELQERVFGRPVSYQADQGMLGNSASTQARSTAAGASSPRLESGAPAASVVAWLRVSGTPHPRPTPSADVHAKTRPLLAEVSAESTPPAGPVHTHGGPSVSVPGVNVPSHAKPPVPGSAASFMDESHLLVTSVPTHAKPKTNEATAESRLAASATAPQRTGVSASAHANVQSLVFSAPTGHPFPGVSAKLGTQQHNETGAPKAPSSPPSHHQMAAGASRGQLEPEPPSTPALVVTSHQPPTSASPGTQTTTLPTCARPALRRPATAPVLSGVPPHGPVEESGGKPSPSSVPLTSHTGLHKATWLGVSPLPLGSSSPRLDGPASHVSHGNEVSPPLVRGALVEGSLPGLRATPVSAAPDVQHLTYSSLGLIQPLNRSDVPAARSLDSPAAGEYLGMPPSLHALSVLVRNADNMVCFQPLQDPTAPPPAGGQGAASAQEMLLLSSSLGFPHLGAPSLAQSMGPPGLILVKPVLVFLPVDRPDAPVRSSAEDEKGAPKASLRFPSKGLAPLGGSQEQPMEARPTLSAISNSTKEKALSANPRSSEQQAMPGPVLSASLWSVAEAGWVRSSSVMTAAPSRYGLAELSARTVSFKSKDQGEAFPSPALDSQEEEQNNPVLSPVGASAEHQVSVPPSVPVVASLQQGAKSSLAPPALRSLTEPSASRRRTSSLLTSRATEGPPQGLRTALVLQSLPQGFVTPLGKDSEGPPSASSAGNVELPLETEQQLLLSKSASASWVEKHPVSVRPVPSAASEVLVLPSEQKRQVSGALNYSRSGTVLEFPVATEVASYPAKGTSSGPSLRYGMTPLAKEGLRARPLFTLPKADARTKTTRGRLEDVVTHPRLSRSPSDVPSHLPVSSYFAKSAPKPNLATLVASGRASLASANMEDHVEPTENAVETNESARVTDVRHPAEATNLTPATFGRGSGHPSTPMVVAELNPTAGPSSGSRQAGDVQRGVNMSSPAPASLLAPNPAHKDLAVSPTAGKMPLLERASGSLSWPDPTASGTSKEQDTPLKPRGGEHEVPVPASPHPQPISLDGAPLERPRLLAEEQVQKALSSLQGPGGSPTSVVSIVLSASTFPMTTLSSGAAADGVGWISHQTSDLQSPLLDTPETSLSLHTQIQPTPGVLSDASEATAEPDMSRDVTGEYDKSRSHTVGERITGRKAATAGAEDPVASQWPGDSDGEAPHRRRLRSDDVFMDGFAVVSDDSCSSGNYTTQMSLRPGAAALAPSSPGSFLALIVVQDNSSRPTLRIKSCCVTPTTRPSGPEAACCLFPRARLACGHIQLHQNGQSRTASFSIQPFRMLNRSVLYLHCELSICLSEQGGCGQGCLEHRETLPRPSDRSSYRTRHNLISFGPLWKDQAASPSRSAAGPAPAVMLLLGSLTGTAFFTAATAIFIWLHRKGKTKMATSVGCRGSGAP